MSVVNIFLADGFEDIEALAVSDVLRRGGVETSLVSISDSLVVRSSHGVEVKADCLLSSLPLPEGNCSGQVMVFPGGMPGAKNLASCGDLVERMRRHYAMGGILAAICASPGLVLSQLDSLEGVEFTCFEGFQDALVDKGARYEKKPAVVCGRIITGRSAGYAVPFGLAVLSAVGGEAAVEKVHYGMYLD